MRSIKICDHKRGENMTSAATTALNDMRIVVIPAKTKEEIKKAAKCLQVAAYCRVSTDDKEQKTSTPKSLKKQKIYGIIFTR